MAKNDLFYNHLKENSLNKPIVAQFENYAKNHSDAQLFLISAPLGERYSYAYEKYGIIILSPGHKLIFFDLNDGGKDFDNYVEDVISDINSISDKYKYMDYIGRAREWKEDLIYVKKLNPDNSIEIEDLLEETSLQGNLKRKSDLLISLLTGSINDIEKIGAEQPEELLDKVKKKIVLFDGEQTRFIYRNYAVKKLISVQGLSGTGKTELLLHKLKELYINDDISKIYFTCHNIALADKLKQRIPRFFDFMKVDKQIKWNERLWMNRAWGSQKSPDTGLYSYICNFYGIPFYRYSTGIDYNFIFSKALSEIKKIPLKQFKTCFDYVLIDESQDFPEVFFELCKKVTKNKVYVAGDVFQDIFDSVKKSKRGFDIVLNRCYRTDPRTLMFAHAVGLGLFESQKLNWFEKDGWENLGYKTDYTEKGYLKLTRLPIKRFEEIEAEQSVQIINDTRIGKVIEIIRILKEQNPTIMPGDIAIILLDDNRDIYNYIDQLCIKINNVFGYKISRGYESKSAKEDAIYITNPNNVKGLEFPFVICITQRIQNTYRYRNSLYTMLTRSFLQSYLLVTSKEGLDIQNQGLSYINKYRSVRTTIPNEEQRKNIQQTVLELQTEQNESYQDFLEAIFEELGVTSKEIKESLTKALSNTKFDKFDKELVAKFIQANIVFYQ